MVYCRFPAAVGALSNRVIPAMSEMHPLGDATNADRTLIETVMEGGSE